MIKITIYKVKNESTSILVQSKKLGEELVKTLEQFGVKATLEKEVREIAE